MRNVTLSIVAALGLSVGSVHAAQQGVDASLVQQQLVQAIQAEVKAFNLLNWQVGEYHEINVDSAFGKIGGGTKSVTKEEKAQNAFWYVTDINVFGQAQKTEALMSRTDGKILKLIVNGKEQDPNGGGEKQELEIIEQSETTVEVPAGKFDCMYVKAKVKSQGQESEIEAWINPVDVNLDGMLKLNINGGFLPLSLVLQKFGKR